ncbi:Hypothetical protein CINCED_3A008233 [Cinara cedri]|uniref:Uncharacterized protein n=1 Tax=Cinara cedri TaxID=506608 RepID=A0A5E4MHB9_9HEMI|nr:Hypothetical protein CINCED_3A008233 [Cinara cedri]
MRDKEDDGCEKVMDECGEPRVKIYVQPEKQRMKRPTTMLEKRTEAVEKNSIYRQSFKPPEAPHRRSAVKPVQNFWPMAQNGEGIANVTIQRASFPEWPCDQRPPPVIQGDHEIGNCEQPIKAVTSQRHDYVKKSVPVPVRYRASDPAIDLQDGCSTGGGGDVRCQMASVTTTTDTFSVKDLVRPQESARPATATHWMARDERMAAVTETSASYVPWDLLTLYRSTECLPYCRPDEPIDDCTVYKRSYKPPGNFRDPLPGELTPVDRFGSSVDSEGHPFYPRAHDYNYS